MLSCVEAVVAVLASIFLTTGCSFGPQLLKGNRTDYNIVISASNNEEMLLNLIRLRHFDAPFFLNVSSVSSSFNFDMSTGFDLKANAGPIQGYKGQYPYNSATPSVGAKFSESPSIIYVPLSGEKFATQLLTEISPDRLFFLSRAGWDIEILLRVLVKQFGPSVNKSFAMDTSLNIDPARTAAFDKLVSLFRRLQNRGDLELQAQSDKDQNRSIVMQLRFATSEECSDLNALLGTRLVASPLQGYSGAAQLVLTQHNDLMAENACEAGFCRVFVRFRNFIGILDALAQGVALPKDSAVSDPQGAPRGTPVPFTVATGTVVPAAAFVSARYDGHWYYIAKDDVASRKVFSFIIQLFALEGGELPKTTPMLTLPVNR